MKTITKRLISALLSLIMILPVGVAASDEYCIMTAASSTCYSCGVTCSYTLEYEQWSDTYHCVRWWCSSCGEDMLQGGNAKKHEMENGVCVLCGYDDGSGVCYHDYTDIDWNGCDWEKYCEDCDEVLDFGTSHGSTYTEWNVCDWYEYCRDCDELLDYGTEHGRYTYGDWEYYNSSRHRRLYACEDCGDGSYDYGYHSTSTQYGQYSSAQHTEGSYCSTCSSYVGSISYESHDFTYGSWINYGNSEHYRIATCSDCGYSITEYTSHSLSYSSWTNYSSSQHRRTVSCSTCGYSTYEYASHSITTGNWSSISGTQHRRSATCSCGYSTTEYGVHYNSNDNGYCDSCNYLMSRFSVTVPATLNLTVAKDGMVYAATTAQIVNNSTGAVSVSSIKLNTENGWQLVPYSTNMANAKVDARLIGFYLNGAESDGTENLPMSHNWQIAKNDALTLDYDAVVSATSEPIDEQVLTIVFVLDWA